MGGGLESRCLGRVCGADGPARLSRCNSVSDAPDDGRMYPCDLVARHHPHRTHDLRSGSEDHRASENSVQKTVYCNSTSNAPDDGRKYPKDVELRIHQ